MSAGTFDFEIGSADWQPQYGNFGVEVVEAGGSSVTLTQTPPGGENSRVGFPAAGCYNFDVTINDANVPPLTIDLSVTADLP